MQFQTLPGVLKMHSCPDKPTDRIDVDLYAYRPDGELNFGIYKTKTYEQLTASMEELREGLQAMTFRQAVDLLEIIKAGSPRAAKWKLRVVPMVKDELMGGYFTVGGLPWTVEPA